MYFLVFFFLKEMTYKLDLHENNHVSRVEGLGGGGRYVRFWGSLGDPWGPWRVIENHGVMENHEIVGLRWGPWGLIKGHGGHRGKGGPCGDCGRLWKILGDHGESRVMVGRWEAPDSRHKPLWLPSGQHRRFPSAHLSVADSRALDCASLQVRPREVI